jgi:type IV secretion system protein VirB10
MSEQVPVKRPEVAAAARRTPVAAAAVISGAIGLGVFFWLAEARAAMEDGEQLPALTATATTPEPAPVAATGEVPPATPQPASSGLFIPNSGPVTLVPSSPGRSIGFAPTVGQPATTPSSTAADQLRERLRAPTLVVDLARADQPSVPGAAAQTQSDSGATERTSGRGAAAPTAGAGAAADRNLSETERFSERVGREEVEVAQARRMTGLDRLIPQGAVIGAVMETALNSDLPGFARGTVARDVRSFDGSAVLIPAGSRLIGQYKSGVAQGASRVFVLWTRLIRPDGVSIELASPATDDLGRGGIGGKVNRHFVRRFGGGILTSVISGAINAAAAAFSGGSTIIVGSAGEAANLASQAGQNTEIPPTITTRQGAAVRVFVARDLDFSTVGPAQ